MITPQFIIPNIWFGMLGTFIFLLFLAYVLWSTTRKNTLHWKRDNQVKLRINGKTLELDMKFISQVWIED